MNRDQWISVGTKCLPVLVLCGAVTTGTLGFAAPPVAPVVADRIDKVIQRVQGSDFSSPCRTGVNIGS